jgi:membrane protease YdiL (CAAX protease family)
MARMAGAAMGVWAWVPIALLFWTVCAFFIYWSGGHDAYRRWLTPSAGRPVWPVLAVLAGSIPLPILLLNWELLLPAEIWIPWLLFALLNPWFEEGYWRGTLLDATKHWPLWTRVLFTSSMFAVSHPLIWGVNSIANFTLTVTVSTFIMGVVWAMVYLKTKSLRWVIAGHVLTDLFNLAVPVFLNLYVPPA